MLNLSRLRPVLLSLFVIVDGVCTPSAWCRDSTPGITVNVSTRDELRQAVANAQPGTRILIAPGAYPGGFSFSQLEGAKDKPIVLAARDANNPPVFKGGSSCLHLVRPKYVELQNLVLTGATANGLNIDDGGSEADSANQIVLRNLWVHDIGPQGNRDGMKLSGVDHFLVEGCTIERWGNSGSAIDMVGCHEGRIVDCVFRHRGDLAANGVQTKGGSARVAIQRCRFENAGGRAVNIGGSTGRDYFRPQSPGYEAKDITVEDCTFIGSMAPIVFVGVDGAVVRHNVIYRPTRWVVRILQESQGPDFVPCRNGAFTNNIVVFRSNEVQSAVNVGGGTAPQTFEFAKNHWFCIDNPPLSRRLILPVKETDARHGEDPLFINEKEHDLRLMKATPVRNAGVRSKPEPVPQK